MRKMPIGKDANHWKGGDVKKVCETCKNIFLVKRYRESAARFCSHKCKGIAQSKIVGDGSSHWKGGPATKICPICETKFFEPKRAKRKRVYCSVECYAKARTKRTSFPCPTCGKMRELRESEIKRGRFFCGIRCYRLHRPTSIELAIQRVLNGSGIDFVPEYQIRRWHIDIFIPAHKLAIECDGVYWHKRTRDTDRDKRKEKFLHSVGIRVIRLTEDEIRNHLDLCFQKIQKAISVVSMK